MNPEETSVSKVTASWSRHVFWNVLEHGSSRGLDAFATIVILWCVPAEVFSQLAVAQAFVAPALFFFVSPDSALYREYGVWMAEGRGAMLARLRVFRRFAWAKGAVALVLAALIAAFARSPVGTDFSFSDRFFSLAWAFTLPLTPQVCGPDREFLRLSLELKTLNFYTFLQRAIYIVLLVPAAKLWPTSFVAIAACGVGTLALTAWLARARVERLLSDATTRTLERGEAKGILVGALRGFSIWNHIAGTIVGWVQTMDLFFLGIFRFPATELGLYGVVLKLANFTLAIPYAIANLFLVYLGRQIAPDRETESRMVFRLTLPFAVFCAIQAVVFSFFAPWLLEVLSRGRWTPEDQTRMLEWFMVILPAGAIFASVQLWVGWVNIRLVFRRLVFAFYLPWLILSAGIYAFAVAHGGTDAAARANLCVVAVYIVLLAISYIRRYE